MKTEQTAGGELEEYIKGWDALIEALPYPVSIHDTEFGVVLANKSFKDICGRKGDIRGMKCYELVHCKDRPLDDCPMARTLKTGNPERAEIYEPALGKYLLVQTAPVFSRDNLIGIVHSVMDITGVKESEESFKERTDVLGESLSVVKKREADILKSRDAFLNMLEDINESYRELNELFMGLVRAMVNALDAKSRWTRGHSERVARYAEEIASEIGMDEDGIRDIRLAALLHDIGKIGTYDYLLDKVERLTDDEFKVIKDHPVQGEKILGGIKQLSDVIPIIKYHHERVDGRGYPDGLKGDEIPVPAMILHVADTFDAIMADRPYRKSPGIEYAVSELKKHSGSQFDAEVVEVFLRIIERGVQMQV